MLYIYLKKSLLNFNTADGLGKNEEEQNVPV